MSGTGGGSQEIELKLGLAAEGVAPLWRHAAIRATRQGRIRRRRVVSVYYDTSDRLLAREGITLRIRRDGRRWLQTLKGTADAASGGGLASRSEYEWPLGQLTRAPSLALDRIADTPLSARIQPALAAGLAPAFTTDFERSSVELRLVDGSRVELAVDRGSVHAATRARGGASRAAISEIELELIEGNPELLFVLAQVLLDGVPLTIEPRSKAERGYALAAGARSVPVHAEKLALPGDATIGAAIAAALRSALRQLEANVPGVLESDDPECVHQLRVGVRRLRSILAACRELLPIASSARLGEELRWLARLLGSVRDADVLATETLPAIEAARCEADDRRLRLLRAAAGARAEAGRRQVRDALRSTRFVRLLLETAALAASTTLGHPLGSDPAARLAQPARAHAARLLDRRQRKLARRAAKFARLSPAGRHDVRIAAKKLRYAADAFAGLFDAARVDEWRKALAGVQKLLGDMNDAAVARTLASELVSPDAPVVATIEQWARSRIRDDVRRFDKRWQKFRAQPPFWAFE